MPRLFIMFKGDGDVKMDNEIKTKVCNKCNRELPMNTDYFFKKCDTKDGFTTKCKECQRYSFSNKLTSPKPKEGYKICKKCNRELKNINAYFPIDKGCKDGLRSICRECNPKYGNFMQEGYIPKVWWSDEENKLFTKIYPYYTNLELIELFYPDKTEKDLSDKAYKLNCGWKTQGAKERANIHKSKMLSKIFKGKPKSEEMKKKLSKIKKEQYASGKLISHWKGRIVSEEERKRIGERNKGIWAGENNPRHINPLRGELNGRWEGGAKELYHDLRDHLQVWKRDSMENCNYKCFLTGLEFHNIHHLYPFKNIVNELFEELHYDKRQVIGDYNPTEVEFIYNKLYELHDKYGLGICLNKNIHKLFHDNFGYTKFNKNDFELFKGNYYKGLYDEVLGEELKSYNSIRRLRENGMKINFREVI